jgi:glycosyltransferase involved in cell wall biosynthesis
MTERSILANLLILSRELPFPLEKGNTLRTYHSCRQLARKHTCILVAFGEHSRHVEALERQGLFKEIHMIRPSSESRSIRRHVRWSNENFVKLSTPEFHNATVQYLKEIARKHRIDGVICFPAILTEFVTQIQNVIKIADSCDCLTLTYERYLSYRKNLTSRKKLITWLTLQRSRNFEKMLLERHDRIVSISPADLGKLKELNPASSHKLRLIPNGVNAELLEHAAHEPEVDNALVFWGNLKFAPNYTAVEYFYRNVYRPFLSERNIKWYIVGGNAGRSIRAMAEADKNIIVTGFIDQLYDFAARIPIMINPMQIGSGLKNKVLEAFALGRTVISNALGIEAIIGAQPGIHYLPAEQPMEYADAIFKYLAQPAERRQLGMNARRFVEERYTWSKVGEQWHRLVDEIISPPLMDDPDLECETDRLRA